jgi:hypothetical protein
MPTPGTCALKFPSTSSYAKHAATPSASPSRAGIKRTFLLVFTLCRVCLLQLLRQSLQTDDCTVYKYSAAAVFSFAMSRGDCPHARPLKMIRLWWHIRDDATASWVRSRQVLKINVDIRPALHEIRKPVRSNPSVSCPLVRLTHISSQVMLARQ